MLPGRRDLATTYGVDRGTIQRALASLVADGTVLTDGTRGTFVNPNLSHLVVSSSPAELGGPQKRPVSLARIGIVSLAKPLGADTRLYGDPSYGRILSGVERVTSGAGVACRYAAVGPFDNCQPTLGDAVSALIEERVSGVVVIDIHGGDRSDEIFRLVEEAPVPIVYVSSQAAKCPIPHVCYDQPAAGFYAADHLVRQDCRKVWFIAPTHLEWLESRLEGARTACRLHSVQLIEQREPEAPASAYAMDELAQVGYLAAAPVLATRERTGVLAANDFYALGVLKRARELGLSPGIDFLLVGFDDDACSREAGLSSMHPPLESLGAEAARMIIRIANGDDQQMSVRTYSHLVRRASSGG